MGAWIIDCPAGVLFRELCTHAPRAGVGFKTAQNSLMFQRLLRKWLVLVKKGKIRQRHSWGYSGSPIQSQDFDYKTKSDIESLNTNPSQGPSLCLIILVRSRVFGIKFKSSPKSLLLNPTQALSFWLQIQVKSLVTNPGQVLKSLISKPTQVFRPWIQIQIKFLVTNLSLVPSFLFKIQVKPLFFGFKFKSSLSSSPVSSLGQV